MYKVLVSGLLLSGCALIPQPICNDDLYLNKWETPIDDCRNNNPVINLGSDNTHTAHTDVPSVDNTPDKPHSDDKPDADDKTSKDSNIGNPGNDKSVGKAGEQDKDVGSSGGSRGASTGKESK